MAQTKSSACQRLIGYLKHTRNVHVLKRPGGFSQWWKLILIKNSSLCNLHISVDICWLIWE